MYQPWSFQTPPPTDSEHRTQLITCSVYIAINMRPTLNLNSLLYVCIDIFCILWLILRGKRFVVLVVRPWGGASFLPQEAHSTNSSVVNHLNITETTFVAASIHQKRKDVERWVMGLHSSSSMEVSLVQRHHESRPWLQLPFRVWFIKKYPADGFNVCINVASAVGSIFNF